MASSATSASFGRGARSVMSVTLIGLASTCGGPEAKVSPTAASPPAPAAPPEASSAAAAPASAASALPAVSPSAAPANDDPHAARKTATAEGTELGAPATPAPSPCATVLAVAQQGQ